MSVLKTSLSLSALGALALVLAAGCSSAPNTESSTSQAEPLRKPVCSIQNPDACQAPAPTCVAPPAISGVCRALAVEIGTPSYQTCPVVPLAGGGSWAPFSATPVWPVSDIFGDDPFATTAPKGTFAASDMVCLYNFASAVTATGAPFCPATGACSLATDLSALCGPLQWTKVAYVFPNSQCATGNNTSGTGSAGCDTCSRRN